MLKQVQGTRLFKHVTDALCSEKDFFCKREQNLGHRDCLTSIAASGCCNSVGGLGSPAEEKNASVTAVSNSIGEVGVDNILVHPSPKEISSESCHSCGMHPENNDVLTVLLLALPPETWSAIKDEKVLEEISGLVSIQSLPPLLVDEVLHLRGQLFVLKRCNNDNVEHDIDAPII